MLRFGRAHEVTPDSEVDKMGDTRSHFFMQRFLFLIPVIGLLTLPLLAEDEEALFDGQTLKGWKSPEMSYWTVEDGSITATSSEDNPCKKNQFLVWRGGEIGDFRLTLSFRVDGGPKANSGIQIRSQLQPDGHAVGYQVDISPPTAPWLGAIYDEHGRKMLAARGEQTSISMKGELMKTSLAESAEKAIKSYDNGGWNTYEIEAVKEKITVKLNGHVTSIVMDHQEAERELSGILALQLHSGPPMKVQFKDLLLTKL